MVTVLPNTTPFEKQVVAQNPPLGTTTTPVSTSTVKTPPATVQPQTVDLQKQLEVAKQSLLGLQSQLQSQTSTPGASSMTIPVDTNISTKQLGTTQSDVYAKRAQLADQLNADQIAKQNEVTTIQNDVLNKMQQLTGKSQAQRQAEIAAGVDSSNAQLGSLKVEAVNLENQMNQALLNTAPEGMGQRALVGEKARIQNSYMLQIGANSAMQQALQGNIELAIQTATKTVNAAYEPIENDLKVALQKLEFKQGDLTKAETKANEAQKQAILDEQAKITDEKDTKNTLMQMAVDAGKNGASNEVMNAIINSTDASEAFKIGAQYIAKETPNTDIVKLDNGVTILIDKNTGEIIKNYGGQKFTGDGGGGAISAGTQAVINNPSLFDDMTATMKGTVIRELQANGYDTANLGVKGLSDTAITSISQSQKALSDLADLKATIQGKESMLGPITGLAALNPWSEARKVQADVDRTRQTVGKALEGGVLRKEDEEKYKKILATLNDTPSTAIYKIDALISSIERDIENYNTLQQASGKSLDVKASLGKNNATLSAEQARKKYGY